MKTTLLFTLFSVTLGTAHVVDTPLGKVRGYPKVSRGGRQYWAYTAVPYAKPPVGNLRFQPPEPLEPWIGVRDISEDSPICIQQLFATGVILGQEDCLYVSVYTHYAPQSLEEQWRDVNEEEQYCEQQSSNGELVDQKKCLPTSIYTQNLTDKIPVLVHFHGGAFTVGTAKWYLPDFLMDEDLVIVNVNYRVGIFGFLTFETSEMPGNQGMKDQVMALRWVQQNIASFGGDPHQVTIIGESAGGASVHHHLVSPLSKGLYQKAIITSGSSYNVWTLMPPGLGKINGAKLMDLIGCPTDPNQALPCAQEKDATEIVSKFLNFTDWFENPRLSFAPILEEATVGAFLGRPISSWQNNPVPLFIGMSSAEGLIRTLSFLTPRSTFKALTSSFEEAAPISLGYYASASNPNEVTKKIKKFYLQNKEVTMDSWVALTNMHSDAWFNIGVLDAADKHTGDVYFYLFDYITKDENKLKSINKTLMFGAPHCGDTPYIWNVTAPGQENVSKLQGEDLKFSQKLVKLWATFIKTGVPEVAGLKWEKWTQDNNNYVHIDNNGAFSLKNGLYEERHKFWDSLNYRDNYDKGYVVNTIVS